MALFDGLVHRGMVGVEPQLIRRDVGRLTEHQCVSKAILPRELHSQPGIDQPAFVTDERPQHLRFRGLLLPVRRPEFPWDLSCLALLE